MLQRVSGGVQRRFFIEEVEAISCDVQKFKGFWNCLEVFSANLSENNSIFQEFHFKLESEIQVMKISKVYRVIS